MSDDSTPNKETVNQISAKNFQLRINPIFLNCYTPRNAVESKSFLKGLIRYLYWYLQLSKQFSEIYHFKYIFVLLLFDVFTTTIR